LSASIAVQSSVVASNIAFLSQSNAFVAAPADPLPGQNGGGVWVRGVGGNLTLDSNTKVSTTTPFFGPAPPTNSTCSTKYSETFAGFQVGSDISKLNIGGWNVHAGLTAGGIEASGDIVGGSPVGGLFPPGGPPGLPGASGQVPNNITSQSPFVGAYIAATNGGFFVDSLVRYNNYDVSLNSPLSYLFNQKIDAHGYSVSGSIGYNYNLPNSGGWFVEPSAGLIWSRTSVGVLNEISPFALPPPINGGFSGTAQTNDITSIIGRVGLRVGTTVEVGGFVVQPFVAASVWHDFAGDITTSLIVPVIGGTPQLVSNWSSSNVGTFGQYSVGVSTQPAAGWFAFARLDYRDGSELRSLSGVGGLRYQFTPDANKIASMPVKAAPRAPAASINWTGVYIGGFGGADFGRAGFDVPGAANAGLYPSGILAGGTVGYNYQLGTYVLGVEGEAAWTKMTGSAACASSAVAFGINGTAFAQTTCHDDVSWLATFAGRVGYLWNPQTLLYVKGGAAWERESFSATCNTPINIIECGNAAGNFPSNPANPIATVSDTRIGGLFGLGIEYALNSNWFVKGEVDYAWFGTKTFTATETGTSGACLFGFAPPPCTPSTDRFALSAPQSIGQVKVGVNYHLPLLR
jgi:opacity protein-like surface antigen